MCAKAFCETLSVHVGKNYSALPIQALGRIKINHMITIFECHYDVIDGGKRTLVFSVKNSLRRASLGRGYYSPLLMSPAHAQGDGAVAVDLLV